MEKINDLVASFGHKVKPDNTIDLGWENGWGKDSINLHRILFEKMDEGSYTRSGSASWRRFSFTVTEDGVTYKVIYSLDSGD